MKTVLVTGSNRGIGLEFVNQLSLQNNVVIATCRNPKQATILQELSKKRPNVSVYRLDVTNHCDINQLKNELANTPIDWLINNAGISGTTGVTLGNIENNNFIKVFETNCLAPLKLSNELLPQIELSQDKLIICISSRMGSISDNQRGKSYAYRSSKAALNCAMRSFALDASSKGINVLLLHPGWVRTSLGGDNAPLDVQASVNDMIKIINQHKDNAHADALLSHNGQIIPW